MEIIQETQALDKNEEDNGNTFIRNNLVNGEVLKVNILEAGKDVFLINDISSLERTNNMGMILDSLFMGVTPATVMETGSGKVDENLEPQKIPSEAKPL